MTGIPIVIAAFGTTTKALETYEFIDKILKKRFADHDIQWAYSSRMVKDWIKKKKDIELRHPHQVLKDLIEQGHSWAVVQSLHLMCGHEFYRLVDEVKGCSIRTSIGLPLLAEPKDYDRLAKIISKLSAKYKNKNEAVVLVGHGTDHPGWTCYPALDFIIQNKTGSGICLGMVEGGLQSRDSIIAQIKKAGFQRVRLIPFMLVAGVHFTTDLIGNEDSWKQAFEQQGIKVSAESNGIGFNRDIIDIYCEHIENALNIIPSQAGSII